MYVCTLCPEKKETKMFFVTSPTKLGRFWRNLVHCFLNKFGAILCKRFPPHPNNVSTLPCETWHANCARATIELLQKVIPEFIPHQLCPPNSPDLNPSDLGNIARDDGVQNRHQWSGAIIDAIEEWLPQWRHDPAWSHDLIRSYNSFRSVMRMRTFPCTTPSCCNQLESNLANLGATVEVE